MCKRRTMVRGSESAASNLGHKGQHLTMDKLRRRTKVEPIGRSWQVQIERCEVLQIPDRKEDAGRMVHDPRVKQVWTQLPSSQQRCGGLGVPQRLSLGKGDGHCSL